MTSYAEELGHSC